MDARLDEIPISDVQYRLLCDLLREECGLDFGESSRFVVEKRLRRRLESIGIDSFPAYLHRLRAARPGDNEMAELIDHLTTNETYFFREQNQLRALMQEILPEMILRRRGTSEPVRIWSAGCSSGEEPSSIVMLALEAGLDPARDIRVYASDISRSMLRKARSGIYREASFRDTPDALREIYFREKDGAYQITDDVKRHIDYVHLNLVDRRPWSLLGAMDVVLCRNVIIYFGDQTKRQLIQGFYDQLVPGGYLLLGHSESLVSLSNAFDLCTLKNDMVYRRPPAGEGRTDSWHRLAAEAIADRDGGDSR